MENEHTTESNMTTEAPEKKPEIADKKKNDQVSNSKATKSAEPATKTTDSKKETPPKKPTPEKAKQSATPKEPKPAKKSSGGGGVVAWLALITSIGAIGGAYWLWQQMDSALDYTQQVSQEVKTNLEQTKNNIENNARLQSEQLNKDVTTLGERQTGIETQLNNLLSRIGNTTKDWNLSEAAYLLSLANHKLQLQRDIKTAITALNLADDRIRTTGDPALLPVRELISKEVTQLEAFKDTDIVGASLKLSAISEEIGKMPLRVRVKKLDEKTAVVDTKPDSSNSVDNLFSAIWNSLKGLITVRYNERPVEALLTPNQVSNLEENLQIRLEQARLALVKNQPELFSNDINKSIEWLKAFYNTDNDRVANAIEQLTAISTINLRPELPDISGSLRKLKTLAKKINVSINNEKAGGA